MILLCYLVIKCYEVALVLMTVSSDISALQQALLQVLLSKHLVADSSLSIIQDTAFFHSCFAGSITKDRDEGAL